jgi:hypothetical protein
MNIIHNFNSFNSTEEFYAGDRIELVYTEDPYTELLPGDQGTVRGVDDIGNILIQWDNGSTLSMIPGIDEIKKIE